MIIFYILLAMLVLCGLALVIAKTFADTGSIRVGNNKISVTHKRRRKTRVHPY